MRSRAVAFQPQTTMWSRYPDPPNPWPSLSRKSMTSATSAPVIVPMIATPNRLKNQPTTQPTGLVTYDESPWPRIVWMPQFMEAPRAENVSGFSSRVISPASMKTRTNARPMSWAKKRRSTAPRTRVRCHPTRRIRGLLKSGARNRCTGGHGATRDRALLAAGRRLHQLDVGDVGDRADDILAAGVRRQPDRQLDLVAALADPLAVDPGHFDAPICEQPRNVAERLQAADLEPDPDHLEPGAVDPGHERVQRPQREDDDERADRGHQPFAGARRHSDPGRGPEARRRREAADRRSVLEDRAGAEEADPGHDLSGDPGRVDRRRD